MDILILKYFFLSLELQQKNFIFINTGVVLMV